MPAPSRLRSAVVVSVLTAWALAAVAPTAQARLAVRWGEEGHTMIGRVAADGLPASMPAFFREAAPQLAYLNPEPDRWRQSRGDTTMAGAMGPYYAHEHYVDLELASPGALAARDRNAFADSLRAAGQNPAVVGALPFRVLELADRLRRGFSLWRHAPDPATRTFIEQRIINDAGILGHYVADAANPHHTTIHHNGWVGDNPKGYTTDRTMHGRFESEYVRTHMTMADLVPLVPPAARMLVPFQDSLLAYLDRSHGQLDRLYTLDRQQPWGAATVGADHEQFTAERMADGARMLRDIWFTAWVTSR
ncbi:MAG: phospholipase C/P1 nuclease family protein [Gemmatimonadaceae bacterium]